MRGYRLFVVLYAVFGILVNESYSSEEQAECKDVKTLNVLRTCCNLPDEVQPTGEEQDVATKCYKSLSGNRTDTKDASKEEQMELSECMAECFFNGTHLLTDEMKLNETALIAEYAAPLQNFPQWKELIAKAVKKCIEKNVVSEVKPEAKCKSGAYQFNSCFNINLYLDCPQEHWKMNDERCTKTRDILQKC